MAPTLLGNVRRAVLGAVLVGGQSRRMGRDKALIEVDGTTMVDRAAELLRAAGCNLVVAIGPDRLAGSVTPLADRYPGEGPLGAIVTALDHAAEVGADAAFVIACDLPDLDVATLTTLLEAVNGAGAQPSVTLAGAPRREPLIAVWATSCLAPLEAAFAGGQRSVHRAIDSIVGLQVVEVQVDPARVRNVNTPDQRRTE